MKKILTLTTLTLFTGLGIAAWNNYAGPQEERISPAEKNFEYTLGWYAQNASAVAVMDVIDTSTNHPNSKFGHVTVRVVNALYGCTNGQEFVILKCNPNHEGGLLSLIPQSEFDEFGCFPTNNSRIVCAFTTQSLERSSLDWTPKVWKLPPQPETIVSPTNTVYLRGDIHCWWPDGYQDNLPLTHLVHAARVERNWTNYYHLCRDAINLPSPSELVYRNAVFDLGKLATGATRSQFDFIMNDPLLPELCRDWLEERRRFVIDDLD